MSRIILPYANGTFSAAVLDPPWDGKEKGCNGRQGVAGYDVNAGSQYPTMKTSEILEFGHEVVRKCKSSFHLWVWTIELFLEDTLAMIPAWGLRRKRTHIWVKTTNDINRTQKGLKQFSKPEIEVASRVMLTCGYTGKPYPRTGHWGKLGHEYLILATNDDSLRTLNGTAEPSVFFAPVPNGRHSAKPPLAFDIIQRNSYGPILSCFERIHRPGITCWGNELENKCSSQF